jgi:Flp pilus assembly protein TadD
MSQEYSFSLPYDAFDLDLVDLKPEDVGSDLFVERVNAFFGAQFKQFGGSARAVLDDASRTIQVRWSKTKDYLDPKDRVLQLLRSGKLTQALPLLWTLHQQAPDDTEVLYNLGVTESELGKYYRAVLILQRLLELSPGHVHGLIAKGVAHVRLGQLNEAEELLIEAIRLEPGNFWALRNFGACLMKQQRYQDAVKVLGKAVLIEPNDLQALVGLGQAYEAAGDDDAADEQFIKAIKLGGPQELIDLAKSRRTKIAHRTMRANSEFRPDVVMYITGALERFESMAPEEIQQLGYEIAVLGQNGLDINDPAQKYTLRSLPGNYSGLHLLSLMYAAFKQFAPNQDVGIDFSKEYAAVVGLRGG